MPEQPREGFSIISPIIVPDELATRIAEAVERWKAARPYQFTNRSVVLRAVLVAGLDAMDGELAAEEARRGIRRPGGGRVAVAKKGAATGGRKAAPPRARPRPRAKDR
jgi:hypothetical protein